MSHREKGSLHALAIWKLYPDFGNPPDFTRQAKTPCQMIETLSCIVEPGFLMPLIHKKGEGIIKHKKKGLISSGSEGLKVYLIIYL